MNNAPPDFLVQLFPMFLFQAVMLFAVVPLARQASKRAWLWVVFAIIPLLGVFAYMLLLGRAVAAVLAHVNALTARVDAMPSTAGRADKSSAATGPTAHS